MELVLPYVPVGESPDVSLVPNAKQRQQILKAVYNARNTLPMMTVDFWGDGPEMMGCIAGGRQYVHVNPRGDVEPCTFVHLTVLFFRFTASPFDIRHLSVIMNL